MQNSQFYICDLLPEVVQLESSKVVHLQSRLVMDLDFVVSCPTTVQYISRVHQHFSFPMISVQLHWLLFEWHTKRNRVRTEHVAIFAQQRNRCAGFLRASLVSIFFAVFSFLSLQLNAVVCRIAAYLFSRFYSDKSPEGDFFNTKWIQPKSWFL